MRTVTWRDVWQRRLAAHFLSRPAPRGRIDEVVGGLCGVHAQMLPSAELSLAVRVRDLTQDDVRQALWSERSLVKTYGLRGTLHLFPTAEIGLWLAALRAKPPAQPSRAAAMPAVSIERLVDAIAEALDGQQLTRSELGRALEARLGAWATREVLPAFGGRMPRWQLALGRAALEGVLAFGPNRGNAITYVRLDQWIDYAPVADGEAALREVARRYLAAYGPTTRTELARWLYTTPRAADALIRAQADIEEVDVEGWRAFAFGAVDESPCAPTVHLLPHFDPYVVGSFPRDRLMPPYVPAEIRMRGTAAPFAVLLVDGLVSGLWRRERRGSRLEIRVDSFVDLDPTHAGALAAQAERIGAFFGCEARLARGPVSPRAHL